MPHPSAPVPLRPHFIDLHAYRPKFHISAPVFDHVRRPEVTSVPTRTLAEVSHFGPCLRLRSKALVGPATHVPGCCCIRPWLAFDGVEKRLWPRVASRSGGPEFTGGRRRRRRQQRRQRGLPEVPMLSLVQEQATAVPTARPEAEVEEDAKGSTSPPAPLSVSVLLGLCRCPADRLGVTRTM